MGNFRSQVPLLMSDDPDNRLSKYYLSLDIDECLVNKGGCSHICINKPGSYRCKCQDGYKLAANKKTCLGNVHNP